LFSFLQWSFRDCGPFFATGTTAWKYLYEGQISGGSEQTWAYEIASDGSLISVAGSPFPDANKKGATC
jgi:hypothetical protein